MALDLNSFFDAYIEGFFNINLNKQNVLDDFKEKESQLKKYEESLEELEKIKNSTKLDLFKNISNKFVNFLSDFDPDDINKNIINVYAGIQYINSIKNDVESVSKKYMFLKNLWASFLERTKDVDTKAIFIETISSELIIIDRDLKNINTDDLARIEDKIEDTKNKIERSITILNDLSLLLKKHFFIGKEAVILEKKISHFIENEYIFFDLPQLVEFFKDVKDEFNLIVKNSKIGREKIKIIKIVNANKSSIETYAFLFGETLLNPSDTNIANPVYIDTEKYVYFDNFPSSGIFEREFLFQNLEIADDQFDALKEFDRKVFSAFKIGIFSGIFLAILLLFNFISHLTTVLLITLIPLLFVVFFNSLKNNIERKYKLFDMFFFFECNYYIIKEGTSLLDIQKIVPKIFINFDKIFQQEQ